MKPGKKKLEKDIEVLEEMIDRSPADAIKQQEDLEKKSDLEEIRDQRMRGYQIRSREEFIKGWEKPSKFFLNLEKNHYVNKTIVELLDEHQNKINDPAKILEMQRSFYQDLFTKKNPYWKLILCRLPP